MSLAATRYLEQLQDQERYGANSKKEQAIRKRYRARQSLPTCVDSLVAIGSASSRLAVLILECPLRCAAPSPP
jgi:hypothetical protein